jgi:hypothetical protein
MKPKTVKMYEWFLVVEGSGSFPLDMLRYDSAFPYREEDSSHCQPEHENKRRIILCRRSKNDQPGSEMRWNSFGWKVLLATTDSYEATDFVREGISAKPWMVGP